MTGLVLMYHRIADVSDDPYGLAVATDHFVEHVEHLSRLRRVVPLREVLESGPAPRIAITFDDGYADNATAAAPRLAEAGLPVTYFITTARLGGQHFWWDRLAAGLVGKHSMPPGLDVQVAGRPLWLDLHEPDSRRTALRFLHRRLRPLPPEELVATVDDVLDRLGAPHPSAHDRTMTVDQLRGMARLPGVEIGSHTRTHLQLGGQRPELQRAEVLGSVDDLTALLGRPVSSFAFPFGSDEAVGHLAPRLAHEAGCDVACSTRPGAVSRRIDRYQLPRLNVQDWNGAELAARIERLVGVR